MVDYLINLVATAIIRSALLLPYAIRVRFFGWVMANFVGRIAGYLRRARYHLGFVWPEMPDAERRRIARACCNNFGRTLIENYSGAELQSRAESARIVGNGLAAIEKARAEGRPVIFVSGHFGNFEVPRRALTARGFVIGGIYRPMSNRYFNAHYEKTMMDVSGPVFPQTTKGLMGFLRVLKKGGMVTILVDVRGETFPDLDFLGKPAPTSTSAAEFAARFNAVMVPYFGRRLENGLDFEVILADPIPSGEPSEMMQAATNAIADLATRYPEQYFWVHRRWRDRTDI